MIFYLLLLPSNCYRSIHNNRFNLNYKHQLIINYSSLHVRRMILDFIKQMPPITRVIMLINLLSRGLLYTGYLRRYDFYFSFEKICQGEVWRLITSLLSVQQSSVWIAILEMYFIINISYSLQRKAWKRGSIDYLYFNLTCLGLIYMLAIIFRISFLADIFYYSILVYFCKLQKERLFLFFFLPIRAKYFIWFAILVFWMIGGFLQNYIFALFVGHSLYFMFNIYHRLGMCRNRDKGFFDTPQFFIHLVSPLFDPENKVQVQGENAEVGGRFW